MSISSAPAFRFPLERQAVARLLAATALVFPGLVRAQLVYYGLQGANVPPAQPTQSPSITLVAIRDGTAYTVRDLDTATNIASGLLSRGQRGVVAGLANNHHYKLSATRPVQAHIHYQYNNATNGYGTAYFLADNGVTEYGRDFTIFTPAILNTNLVQYWVFANGAGTVTLKTLAGATLASNTFAAAGAWQLPAASLASNTTYVLTSANVDFLVEQSSHNAASEVPPAGQAASPGSCSIPGTGRSFFFHAQPYNGNPSRIAVFPYANGSYTVTRLAVGGCSAGTVISNRAVTAGTLDIQDLDSASCAFRVTATADIAIMAGATEGSTSEVYDMGDDAIMLRGNGNQIRGHALRCGGTIFAGQDGTTVNATGLTSGTTFPANRNADGYIDFSGNSANNVLFNVTSQDAAHPMVIQVFGGNCDTSLNDWQKAMRPAALAAPIITRPTSGAATNALNPVQGAGAIPGATVSVTVYNGSGVPIASGSAVAAADGSWSVTVSPVPPDGSYTIKAVQGMGGVCAVNPNPAGGTAITFDTTPPAAPVVSAPANNSSSTNATPVISGTAEANSTVAIYVDGVLIATVTANGAGAWSYALTPAQALALGAHTVYATATDAAGNLSASSPTNSFNVTHPAPGVSGPIYPTDTTIAGTSAAAPGTLITIYRNGVAIGTTTVQPGGTWTLTGVSGLAGNDLITATAGAGAAQSPPSTAVSVAALPGLLRNGALGTLGPTAAQKAAIFPRAPDPGLARADLVVTLFAAGAAFPQESSDYTDTTTPIVFYQLEANVGNSLRVSKDRLNRKLVINY